MRSEREMPIIERQRKPFVVQHAWRGDMIGWRDFDRAPTLESARVLQKEAPGDATRIRKEVFTEDGNSTYEEGDHE